MGLAASALVATMIAADRMVVPTEYQRDFDDDRAIEIGEHFDWNVFGAVTVNLRPDGTLVLVDGQHRWWAARLAYGDDVLVPCVLLRLATIREEADAFERLNTTSRKLSFGTRFRARLIANKPDDRAPHELAALLADCCLRPGYSREGAYYGSGQYTNGTVRALATVERCYTHGSARSLHATFGPMRQAWGDDDRAYAGYLLGGVWLFVVPFEGGVRVDHLVKVLHVWPVAAERGTATNDRS